MPGPSKLEIDTFAQVIAVQYVLEQVAKVAFLNAGLKPEHVATMQENAKTTLEKETITGLEAVWSDHMASEIATRVDEILLSIGTLMRRAMN
jgi:hypothetical protein